MSTRRRLRSWFEPKQKPTNYGSGWDRKGGCFRIFVEPSSAKLPHGPEADALGRAERLLALSDVIRVDAEMFDRAGRLEPMQLRSIDALHIAAATTLGEDLAGMVVYHDRLRSASEAADLVVLHYGHDFDLIASVTGQRTEWIVPAGHVP